MNMRPHQRVLWSRSAGFEGAKLVLRLDRLASLVGLR